MMGWGKARLAILAAVMLAVPAGAQAGHANGAPRVISVHSGDHATHERITLSLDKAAIVELNTDARDVLVSNPSIVDAVVRSPRRIFLMAQKIGQTNAFFFDGHGHQLLSIDIRVERDVTDLSNMLKSDMPGAKIKVAALNDNVVLTGTVENAGQSKRAEDLAGRFVGDPKKVVNMLQIGSGQQVMLKVRVAEVQRSIAKQFGIDLSSAAVAAGVPIIAGTSNPFGLMGRALSDASGAQIGSVCPGAFTPSTSSTTTTSLTNSTTAITNTSTNQQLLQPGTANGVSALANTAQSITKNMPCTSPNNLQGVIKALEQVGLMHTLAEPNLVAVSGETAKFLAGGEFPVPSGRDSSGNVSVTFKKFGVGLSFTPVVVSPGRISLQISTEVSELTNTGSFTMSGGSSTNSSGQTVTVSPMTIPALAVRRAETTVELPSGGSFAIAGLMQHTNKQVLDSFPGLKDMPILGALFRSRDYQDNETELVVLVSAYLVNPVKGDKIALPTDGFVPPTDVQTILMGKLNQSHKTAAAAAAAKQAAAAKAAGDGKTGFIIE